MTVQTEFTSWQTSPKKPDPKKCSPIMQAWWTYLRIHWGGQNLGCYANRPVVGGTSISSHGSGAALDWRYQDPGCGRKVMLGEAMPFLINNSREIGLQAIHDYAGKRIWRPPSCSGRPAQPSPDCGWQANSGPQMHPANTWLHLEVLPSRWSDTRTVAQMLAASRPPIQPRPIPKDEDMRVPAVVWVEAWNRIDTFVRGSDGGLWHNWWDGEAGAYSPWEGLGGQLVGSPSATTNGRDRMDVTAMGTDGNEWHIYYVQGKGWFPWELVAQWP